MDKNTRLVVQKSHGLQITGFAQNVLDSQTQEALIAPFITGGEPYMLIDVNNFPMQDLDFIDAFEVNSSEVRFDLNIDKAREITKARLRQERIPFLQALDVQFQRALETGSDTSVIVAKKQGLRDLPLRADSINTLKELRSIKAS